MKQVRVIKFPDWCDCGSSLGEWCGYCNGKIGAPICPSGVRLACPPVIDVDAVVEEQS